MFWTLGSLSTTPMYTKFFTYCLFSCLTYCCSFSQLVEWDYYAHRSGYYDLVGHDSGVWVLGFHGAVHYEPSPGNTDFFDSSNSPIEEMAVYGIAEDSAGNMWFAANGNLHKYDGTNWSTYNSPLAGISELAADGNAIWGQGYYGVEKFENGQWTTFDSTNSGFVDGNIEEIVVGPGGKIYFGGAYRIMVYDGQNLTSIDGSNSNIGNHYIRDIAVDTNGVLWIASSTGLLRYNGNNNFTIWDLNNSSIPSQNLYDVAISPTNEVWLASYYGAPLIKFDGTQFVGFNSSDFNMLINTLDQIAFDDQGDLWAYSWYTSRLIRYDMVNFTEHKPHNHPFNGNHYSDLVADGNRILVFQNEAWAWDQTAWTPLAPSITNFPAYTAMRGNDGKLWMGTAWYLWEDAEGTPVSHPISYVQRITQTPDSSIYFLRKADGVTGWEFGSYTSNQGVQLYPNVLPMIDGKALVADDNGVVWIATGTSGLVRYASGNVTTYNMGNSDIPGDWLNCVRLDSQGTVWVSYRRNNANGLASFDGTVWMDYPLPIGVFASDFRFAADGTLWGGGSFNLFKFDSGVLGVITRADSSWWQYNRWGELAITDNGNVWLAANEEFFATPGGLWTYREGGVATGRPSEMTTEPLTLTAYPNPMQEVLNVSFSLQKPSPAELSLIDLQGRTLLRKDVGILPGGSHTLPLNLPDLAAGIYFLNLQTPGLRQCIRVMVDNN